MSRRVGPESHRGLSLLYWAPVLSVEAKLAEMNAAGIDLAVLSRGCDLRSALPVIAPV